jgi:hypothetical protein
METRYKVLFIKVTIITFLLSVGASGPMQKNNAPATAKLVEKRTISGQELRD